MYSQLYWWSGVFGGGLKVGGTIRRKTGKKVWLEWDCSYCDTKGIHGSLRDCPNCGRPRGIDVKYQESAKKEYLTAEEVQTHQNPDWMCECCDSYNSDTLQVCKSCGAPRGASKDYFEIQKAQEAKKQALDRQQQEGYDTATDESSAERAFSQFYENPPNSSDRESPDNRKSFNFGRWKGLFFGILSILAVFMVVGLRHKLLSPKPVSFTVNSKSWEYSIGIEELRTIKDDGWSLPSDARLLDKEWKVKEYDKKVFDHYETVEVEVEHSKEVWDHDDVSIEYEDEGNGAADEIEVRTPIYRTEYWTETEETQEAVYRYEDIYDWYYYYEYDRWRQVRSIDTSGTDTKPEWGTYILNSKEREGTRSKKYTISVTTADKESKVYEMTENDWFKVNSGDIVDANVDIFGSITKINMVNDIIWE